MGLYQTKNIPTETGNKPERKKTTYRLGENLSNYKSDKRLISKIYKKLIQFNSWKMRGGIDQNTVSVAQEK